MPIFTSCIGRNGVVAILFVQIYNWFPLSQLPWILAIVWFSIHMGYIVWINIDLEYNFIKYWSVGFFFFVFAIIDYLYFMSHPSHANIFVDELGRSQEQK